MSWWKAANKAIDSFLLKISGGKNEWYPCVREVVHFLGGVLIGTGTYLITLAWSGPWMWIISGVTMYTILGFKEHGDMSRGQLKSKLVCDLLYWGFGFVVMFSVTYLRTL